MLAAAVSPLLCRSRHSCWLSWIGEQLEGMHITGCNGWPGFLDPDWPAPANQYGCGIVWEMQMVCCLKLRPSYLCCSLDADVAGVYTGIWCQGQIDDMLRHIWLTNNHYSWPG